MIPALLGILVADLGILVAGAVGSGRAVVGSGGSDAAVPLHGGSPPGMPGWAVLFGSVVGFWLLVAAVVVVADRLLAPAGLD